MTLNVADEYTYWRIVARKCYNNTKCLNGGICREDYEHSTYKCECPGGVGGYHCEHKSGEYLNSHSNNCSTQMLQKLPTRSFPSVQTSNFMNSFITKSQVTSSHRCGNDFSVGSSKIGEKQSRQSNPKYNNMQYVFVEKSLYGIQWGVGQSPPKLGVLENFCVKSICWQSVVRLLVIVSYEKKNWGAWCTTCCPSNTLGRAAAFWGSSC